MSFRIERSSDREGLFEIIKDRKDHRSGGHAWTVNENELIELYDTLDAFLNMDEEEES